MGMKPVGIGFIGTGEISICMSGQFQRFQMPGW
jgi:hypothetical protein